jgi:type II secretory pathway pseudopilin PulG
MWRSFGRSRAFTFIELILVILLVAVIVSLAVPLLSRTHDRMQVESVGLNIKKLLLYGRERALSSGSRYRMVFDSDLRGYELEAEADVSVGGRAFTGLEGRIGGPRRIPDGIETEASTNEVVIHPDGTIDEVVLRVIGRSGNAYVLTTTGTTGRVTFAEAAEE